MNCVISLAAAYWDWNTCIRVDTFMVQVVGIGDNGIGYETGESASFSIWCVEIGLLWINDPSEMVFEREYQI